MEQPKEALWHHTRGLWKSGELKAITLGILRQCEREVDSGIAFMPYLTAERIALITGANLGSIRTLLKRWVRGGHIKRLKSKPYGYAITPHGNRCFEILCNGYISRRHHRWVQVSIRAIIRRLPGYQARGDAA